MVGHPPCVLACVGGIKRNAAPACPCLSVGAVHTKRGSSDGAATHVKRLTSGGLKSLGMRDEPIKMSIHIIRAIRNTLLCHASLNLQVSFPVHI